jgi:hypothetical protein
MEQDSEKEHPPACHEGTVSAQPMDTSEDEGVLNKAYRKIDCRLLTWYALVFLLMKIESHNITNAAIMNIEVSTLDCIMRSRLIRIHRSDSKVRISSTSSATCQASSGL